MTKKNKEDPKLTQIHQGNLPLIQVQLLSVISETLKRIATALEKKCEYKHE